MWLVTRIDDTPTYYVFRKTIYFPTKSKQDQEPAHRLVLITMLPPLFSLFIITPCLKKRKNPVLDICIF